MSTDLNSLNHFPEKSLSFVYKLADYQSSGNIAKDSGSAHLSASTATATFSPLEMKVTHTSLLGEEQRRQDAEEELLMPSSQRQQFPIPSNS